MNDNFDEMIKNYAISKANQLDYGDESVSSLWFTHQSRISQFVDALKDDKDILIVRISVKKKKAK